MTQLEKAEHLHQLRNDCLRMRGRSNETLHKLYEKLKGEYEKEFGEDYNLVLRGKGHGRA